MIWTPRAEEVFLAYAAVYREPPEVRDAGLLQSTVERSSVVAFGVEQYPTIDEKAAALLDSFCRNHSLIDGNKRCAWIAIRLVYYRNAGAVWTAGDDAAYDLVMRAATEHLDVPDLAAVLRDGFDGVD